MIDNQRIKKVVNWMIFQGIAANERDLAEQLGYTKSSFSQIVNGKVKISDRFIKKLCSLNENVNEVWIKTGEGEMIKATGDNVINSIGDHNHNTTTINGAGNATTLDKAMDEIAAQRRLTEKSQQQIDRLLTIIESMNSK